MPDLASSLRDLIDRSAEPVDVDRIVRARRRRRRQRRAVAGAAFALVVVLVVGGVATRSTSPEKQIVDVGGGPRVSEADATREALASLQLIAPKDGSSGDTITVTDLATGRPRDVRFPVEGAQGIGYPFLALGSRVVFAVNLQTGPYDPAIGTAYVASPDFAQWRVLGPASAYVPSVERDGVWLMTDNATPDQRLHGVQYGTTRTVTEVGLDGTSRTPSYPLTDHRSVVAATRDGLLTKRPVASHPVEYAYEVWDPAANRVVRSLSIASYVVDAADRYAAWTATACVEVRGCPLHITDLETGSDRTYAPPAGMQWSERAFSPDGSRLALVATPPPTPDEVARDYPPGYVPSGTQPATIVELDPSTGGRSTWSARMWKGGVIPQWSPDGSLLFFTIDREHVGYVNATYDDGPVRQLSVPSTDLALVVRRPASPTDAPRFSYDGPVAASAQHSAELCIYPTAATAGDDGCAGPLVGGWDANEPNGRYHLVGTYDGAVFTLTQPPSDASSPTLPPPAAIESGCPTPPGGWREPDPAHISGDAYNAVIGAATSSPDFAGVWNTANPGARYTYGVLNFAFTRDIDEHRRQLAAIWGGPICVVQHPRRWTDLERISQELFGAVGRELGIQPIAGGADDVHNVVSLEVVAATPALQHAVDVRFGAGTVVLNGYLKPVSSTRSSPRNAVTA